MNNNDSYIDTHDNDHNTSNTNNDVHDNNKQ